MEEDEEEKRTVKTERGGHRREKWISFIFPRSVRARDLYYSEKACARSFSSFLFIQKSNSAAAAAVRLGL